MAKQTRPLLIQYGKPKHGKTQLNPAFFVVGTMTGRMQSSVPNRSNEPMRSVPKHIINYDFTKLERSIVRTLQQMKGAQ